MAILNAFKAAKAAAKETYAREKGQDAPYYEVRYKHADGDTESHKCETPHEVAMYLIDHQPAGSFNVVKVTPMQYMAIKAVQAENKRRQKLAKKLAGMTDMFTPGQAPVQ